MLVIAVAAAAAGGCLGQSVVGPAWFVAGHGKWDILAVATQEPPVAVPPVARRFQVVGASTPLVVPLIEVAVAVAAQVVVPNRPEMVVQSAMIGQERNLVILHCLLQHLLVIWVERRELRRHHALTQ